MYVNKVKSINSWEEKKRIFHFTLPFPALNKEAEVK